MEKIATNIMNNWAGNKEGLSAARAQLINPSRSTLPEKTVSFRGIKFRLFFERPLRSDVRDHKVAQQSAGDGTSIWKSGKFGLTRFAPTR
jgi:hypothetical protein